MAIRRQDQPQARAGGRIWYAGYNLCLHLGAGVGLPLWMAISWLRGGRRAQVRERLGRLPAAVARRFGKVPGIWIHAASAGETASAAPLVQAMRAAWPDVPILFTVTSPYGKQMGQRLLAKDVDGVVYAPLDLPVFLRRVLNLVRPRLFLMVETDLWPNQVRLARRQGAAVAVVSGHAGASQLPRSFWKAALAHVDLFCMQTEADAANIIRRGARPERVHVLGNLKFDTPAAPQAGAGEDRRSLGWSPGVPVLVAGSVLAEDEAPVLDTVAALRRSGLDLHLVMAPRRLERVEEIEKLCGQRGLQAVRRTGGESAPVLILDTMGELAGLYAIGQIAYVGGGLTASVGLHNLLEPLAHGVPVIFGPHHGKAWRMAAEVLRLGAGTEVADGAALARAVGDLLHHGERRQELATAAAGLMALHRGATGRMLARLRQVVA